MGCDAGASLDWGYDRRLTGTYRELLQTSATHSKYYRTALGLAFKTTHTNILIHFLKNLQKFLHKVFEWHPMTSAIN